MTDISNQINNNSLEQNFSNLVLPKLENNHFKKTNVIFLIITSVILTIIIFCIFSFNKKNNQLVVVNNKEQEEFQSQILSGNLENIHKITQITPEIAKAIVRYKEKGDIYLYSINDISPEVIQELIKHKDGTLYLGITSITPEIAKELAKYEGGLSLDGLTSITPEIAELISNAPISLEQKQEFKILSQEEIIGIGIFFTQDEPQKIIHVVPNGPADIAGLKKGDLITKITDKNKNLFNIDIKDYTSIEISDLIKGPVGSELTLSIYRENEKNNFNFNIIRNVVKDPNITNLENTIRFARTLLSLNGIKKIDTETIDKITNINGKYNNLYLGLTSIDSVTARKLATHAVVLNLGLQSITPEVATELTKCEFLFLNDLENISSESAKALVISDIKNGADIIINNKNAKKVIDNISLTDEEINKIYQEIYTENN